MLRKNIIRKHDQEINHGNGKDQEINHGNGNGKDQDINDDNYCNGGKDEEINHNNNHSNCEPQDIEITYPIRKFIAGTIGVNDCYLHFLRRTYLMKKNVQ